MTPFLNTDKLSTKYSNIISRPQSFLHPQGIRYWNAASGRLFGSILCGTMPQLFRNYRHNCPGKSILSSVNMFWNPLMRPECGGFLLWLKRFHLYPLLGAKREDSDQKAFYFSTKIKLLWTQINASRHLSIYRFFWPNGMCPTLGKMFWEGKQKGSVIRQPHSIQAQNQFLYGIIFSSGRR